MNRNLGLKLKYHRWAQMWCKTLPSASLNRRCTCAQNTPLATHDWIGVIRQLNRFAFLKLQKKKKKKNEIEFKNQYKFTHSIFEAHLLNLPACLYLVIIRRRGSLARPKPEDTGCMFPQTITSIQNGVEWSSKSLVHFWKQANRCLRLLKPLISIIIIIW